MDDWDTAIQKWTDAKALYPTAFASCDTTVTDPLEEWQKKMDDLFARPDYETVEKTIYDDNKEKMDENWGYMNNSWDRGVFFDSGLFAGRNDYILLTNAPPSASISF